MVLDLADRLVVIVGGGAVAARKASGVLSAGATRVRCVSPLISDEMPGTVERIGQNYDERHLDGAGLVFAATDRHDVNDAVVRDARRRGILVNRADSDDELPGDFSTPAKFGAGPVTVTVSGGSPAISAVIRDDLAAKIDGRLVRMAEAMRVLRPQIKSSGLAISERVEVFRELARPAAIQILDEGGMDALRAWLQRQFPELSHG